MKKKILICGGTGFIGRNLIDYFSINKNYEIHATHFTRPPFRISKIKWYKVDLRNPKNLKSLFKDMNIVIQAAATTSGVKDVVNNPSIHITDNAVMNSYIFKEARKSNINHLIFFSCSIMYHNSKKPLREKDFKYNKKINEKYFGAAETKLYLEKMCEFYSRNSYTKFTAIRHSNVYGPYDKFDLDKSHFVGASITKILTANNKIIIWGSGSEKRDLLYVYDLCDFVNKCIKKQTNPFKIYNCGSGKAFSVNEVVKMIINISEKKLTIDRDLNKPSIKSNIILNYNLAKKEIGWKPKTKLYDGLQKTIIWWKKNINKLN